MSHNPLRIGVAVTTMNRPKTLKLWLRKYERFCQPIQSGMGVEFVLHIQHDYKHKRRGIAASKNECLRVLMAKQCDYLFLFDDDCFPIHPQWWQPFVEACLRTGQHHFLWLMDDSAKYPITIGRKKLNEIDGVSVFRNSQGCCMFLTRQAVEVVGAFDESLGTYGGEHEDYSIRIHGAGLTYMGPYLSVPGIEEYIYSLDIQGADKYAAALGNEYDAAHNRARSSIPANYNAEKTDGTLTARKRIHLPLMPAV